MSGGKRGLALAGFLSFIVGGCVVTALRWFAGISWWIAAVVALICVLLAYMQGAYVLWDKADRRAAEATAALVKEQEKPSGPVGFHLTGSGHTLVGNMSVIGPSPMPVGGVIGGPGLRKRFMQESVRLFDLVPADQPPILRGFEFDGCDIYGPAVVLGIGGLTMINCTFDADLADVFIEVTLPRRFTGIIGLDACRFTDCRLHQVAIAAPPDFIRRSVSGTTLPPDQYRYL